MASSPLLVHMFTVESSSKIDHRNAGRVQGLRTEGGQPLNETTELLKAHCAEATLCLYIHPQVVVGGLDWPFAYVLHTCGDDELVARNRTREEWRSGEELMHCGV